MNETASAPRLARPFVAVVLALMAASALFLWEPWPFTSFRLFSHLRYDEQTGWEATVLGPDGGSVEYPVASLDHGLRGFGFAMAEFTDASVERRDELCRAWVAAVPASLADPAQEVRIYVRRWRLSERHGERAAPGTRELMYVCTEAGARPVADPGGES
jgi:hypothetical protein